MAKFCVPEVGDNPDGWGPTEEPAHLKNIPYAPFSKSEKLGKVADFTQQSYQKNYGRTHHTAQPLVFNFLPDEEVRTSGAIQRHSVAMSLGREFSSRRYETCETTWVSTFWRHRTSTATEPATQVDIPNAT